MEKPPYSLAYLRQVLAAYFADKPVRRVQVFGSYARGEATAESDLDILLSLEANNSLSLFDISRYKYELEDALQLSVDIGTQIDPYIQRYVKRDLIIAYERAAA